MMRLPRVACACLLFPATPPQSGRPKRLAGAALAFGLGMALSLGCASAQTPAAILTVTAPWPVGVRFNE